MNHYIFSSDFYYILSSASLCVVHSLQSSKTLRNRTSYYKQYGRVLSVFLRYTLTFSYDKCSENFSNFVGLHLECRKWGFKRQSCDPGRDLAKGPFRTKNTTTIAKRVNYYAVVFLLRRPDLLRRGPFSERENACNSQENDVRTRCAAIVNRRAVLKILRVVN